MGGWYVTCIIVHVSYMYKMYSGVNAAVKFEFTLTPSFSLIWQSRFWNFHLLRVPTTTHKMSIRKRNEFLDVEESDNEASDDYQSDALEESKGAITSRTTKRRKVDHSDDEDSDEDLDLPTKAPATKKTKGDARFAKLQEFEEDDESAPLEGDEDVAEDALDEDLAEAPSAGRNAPKKRRRVHIAGTTFHETTHPQALPRGTCAQRTRSNLPHTRRPHSVPATQKGRRQQEEEFHRRLGRVPLEE
jgi:hypothetical protein